MNYNNLKEYAQKASSEAIKDFLTSNEKINVSEFKNEKDTSEIAGPSIDVIGDKCRYVCTMQYQEQDRERFIKLLGDKYSFINSDELPEIDLLDFLGEYLNILCGKINFQLENFDNTLNVDIPYFTYEFETISEKDIIRFQCQFDEISFDLYFQFLIN